MIVFPARKRAKSWKSWKSFFQQYGLILEIWANLGNDFPDCVGKWRRGLCFRDAMVRLWLYISNWSNLFDIYGNSVISDL